MKTKLLFLAMLIAGIFTRVYAQTTLYGITGTNMIFTMANTNNPAAIGGPYTISGVAAGQALVALDVRPATGVLYALGYDSVSTTTQLYTITNTGTTFTAHAVGAATSAIDLGSTTNATFDFISTTDNLVRIIGRNGNNYVMNADYGSVVSTGSSLFSYATGDVHSASSGMLAATAYTNSFIGSDATTEVGYDATNNVIVTFTPGSYSNGFNNTSNVMHSVGITTGLVLTAGSSIGMDAWYDTATHSNTLFVSASGLMGTHLYSYNLTSGAAGIMTDLGAIGSGSLQVKDIALSVQHDASAIVMGELLTGLTLNMRNLVFFDSYRPQNILREVTLNGITPGQSLIAIDYSGTGMLYGLGYNSVSHNYQLYIVDTMTGHLTAVNTTPASLNLGTDDGSGNYVNAGFRFISTTPGMIRVTGNNGAVNVRLNAGTGLITASDTALQYITGDPSFGTSANLTSIAYTGWPGDSVTQMFGFDANTGALIRFTATNSMAGYGIGSSGYISTDISLNSVLSLLLHTSAYNNSSINIAYSYPMSGNVGFIAANYFGDSANQLNYSVLYDMSSMLTAYNKGTVATPVRVGTIGYGVPVRDIALRRGAVGPTGIVGNPGTTIQLLAYPNPVVYKTRIQLPHPVIGKVYFDVVDLAGHVDHASQTLRGADLLEVDMSIYPPGPYTINVYGVSTEKNYVRIVKQ